MDTQSSIEFYHGALKKWLNVDVWRLWNRKVGWLLWRLSNLVSNHYIYLMERKFNGFVVNKAVEKILRKIFSRLKIFCLLTLFHRHIHADIRRSNLWLLILCMRLIDHILNLYIVRARGYYAETFVSINVPSYYKIPIFWKYSFELL